MSSASANVEPFLTWFCSHGGSIDSSVGLTTFPGHGVGAVAKQDIPADHLLFTIPRALTLSTETCKLPELFGVEAWKTHRLNEGWAGLILCMMWEESRGSDSPWAEYLRSLPDAFDTPMFWNDEDLRELQGTSVVEKLGKEDAARDYAEKLLPAIQSRLDLFPAAGIGKTYTLERYHVMGSRILSRSFNVGKWESGNGDAAEDESSEHENVAADTSADSGMDIDDQDPHGEGHGGDEHDDDDSDDEGEKEGSDVAMVPMADMLNAQWESENAKLFYEETELKMVSTRPIKAGEEILNTYGDLPNSDLLRRYGHVDLLPLADGELGNPGDVVEIRADLLVDVLLDRKGAFLLEEYKARIEWWLEEGEDDTFVIESPTDMPEALVAMVRLLTFSPAEWEKTQEKGKVPKPKLDATVLEVVVEVLKRRLGEYPTALEVDRTLLSEKHWDTHNINLKHAIVVRMGEKRLLTQVRDMAAEALDRQAGGNRKRKGGREGAEDKDQSKKKTKRS